MAADRLVKQLFKAEPEWHRPVGRPRTRWKYQSDALIRRAGFDPLDATAILQWQLIAPYGVSFRGVCCSDPIHGHERFM